MVLKKMIYIDFFSFGLYLFYKNLKKLIDVVQIKLSRILFCLGIEKLLPSQQLTPNHVLQDGIILFQMHRR